MFGFKSQFEKDIGKALAKSSEFIDYSGSVTKERCNRFRDVIIQYVPSNIINDLYDAGKLTYNDMVILKEHKCIFVVEGNTFESSVASKQKRIDILEQRCERYRDIIMNKFGKDEHIEFDETKLSINDIRYLFKIPEIE